MEGAVANDTGREMALLEVRGLGRSYRTWPARRIEALRGLDLRLSPGDVLGVIGPNGSGKTTAIRCVLGLLAPTRGEVRVFGHPAGSAPARRSIGFAPEVFDLSGKRSGEETLVLLGRLSGLGAREAHQAARRALERLGIADAGGRALAGYSKGMRRRLSVAAAVQHDPALLVLDEPFDGLDPLGCALVRDEIARASARGAGVLVSSHALAELESVASHLLVLDRGEVLEQGPRDEVLRREGVTALEIEGLDAAARDHVLAEIARHGAVVSRAGPARESLEELFRRRIARGGADRDDRGGPDRAEDAT